jgi:Xaa-Pro aminopeptidase
MSARAERVERRLAEAEVGALLVTDLLNVRYLTGFTGSNAMVVLGPGIRRFVTDFRYLERAAGEVDGFEIERGPADFLAALATGWPQEGLRLGFEDHKVTVRQHGKLRDVLPEGVELADAGGLVEQERMVKEAGELQRIRAAAELADAAFAAVLEQGLAGRTERDVAMALEHAMRTRGGEPSFATIVASAAHGSLPHATPTDEPIPGGTLVTIDWGAQLDGYCSDCTRTVATAGDLPDALREVHELVLAAQLASLAAVRPGPTGKEVDAVARDVIGAGGHAEHFGHGLGHGVGLEVHEAPRLSVTGTDTLAAGHVVTVEPGVYVPGTGGARIEDLVVVTDGGHDVLSGHPKDLLVV